MADPQDSASGWERLNQEVQGLRNELQVVRSAHQEALTLLERTESDLTNVVASSGVATLILDRQQRVRRFTPLAANLWGLQPEDIGRPFGEVWRRFKEDTTLLADCQTVMQTLSPVQREVQAEPEMSDPSIWPTDSEIWNDLVTISRLIPGTDRLVRRCFQRRVLPYCMTRTHVCGVVVTLVDISYRVFAQAQSQRLSTILEDASDALIVHDFEGRIIAWNRGAQRLYGYTEREALTMNISDLLPTNRQSIPLQSSRQYEAQRRTKDGRILDVRLTLSPHRDTRGNLVGMAITEQDITAQKLAEHAKYVSDEQTRAILNAAVDAIITIDHQGIINVVNPATQRMFGYAADELIGRNVNILMPSPYHEEHDEYIAHYLATGEARIIGVGREVVGRRKDGSTFPVELAVSRVDHLKLFTGIIRDISRRKQLEWETLSVAANEQRRIGQELHDGTGQELTGLGLFAGVLVDQLGQLPQAEGNNSESFRIEQADLDRLRQTAARLAEGINQTYRNVKKLSHGIMPVEIEREGLHSALQELAAATDAQHSLSCRCDCDEPVIVEDSKAALQLFRIAQEAVNNAVRHSQASEIRLRLRKDDREIILEVSDNGVGFDEARINRPGLRAKGGLGLSIMGHRAQMIDGRIRVISSEGSGTTIRCVIPAGKSDQP